MRAPVLGEEVVQDVVDADNTDEAVDLIDDGHRHEVVRGEDAGDLHTVLEEGLSRASNLTVMGLIGGMVGTDNELEIG